MSRMELPVSVNSVHVVRPRLDLYYPVVEGLPNFMVQQRINQTILNMVNSLLQQQGYYQNPQTTVTALYELKNNQRRILSLSLINYAFSGGAHGWTIIKSPTFNVETGKVYELKELFKPGADYVKRLSEIIKVRIKERDIPLLVDFKSIRPDQDYYIADKCLVIYFQLYEITPYVYGFPYFPISVYEIQDIIDENGPLGVMMY